MQNRLCSGKTLERLLPREIRGLLHTFAADLIKPTAPAVLHVKHSLFYSIEEILPEVILTNNKNDPGIRVNVRGQPRPSRSVTIFIIYWPEVPFLRLVYLPDFLCF